jgi:phage terminase large subunit-like protein
VAEVNYGGDMVVATIEGIWPAAPVERVTASRGKAIRAEPIASLYEQGRVHHVGLFPELEEQMCAFPIESSEDDELDAAVWALTALSGTHEVIPFLYFGRVSGWGFR